MFFKMTRALKYSEMYQKWMKTRPRLKALDMYANGCETIKGSAKRICKTVEQASVNRSILDDEGNSNFKN